MNSLISKLTRTKKVLITVILVAISLTSFSQTPYLWQKTYSSGTDIYYNTSLNNAGEYIMISNVHNSLDTNKITRFDSLGDIILQKSFIDTVGVVHSILHTEKNTFLLGGWKYDQNLKYHIALMEINNNLDTIWQKTYSSGNGHESFRDFVTTQDSGFVVLARSWTNGGAITLIKLNSTGNVEWSELFGSTVNYSPGVLLPKDDGYNIVGTIINGSNTDFFITKTDLNGKVKWTKKIESAETEGLREAQLMNNGNILLSGRSINSFGYSSLLLIMTDSLANIMWSKTYSNSGAFSDTYSDIELINDTTIIAVGIADGWTSTSNPTPFVQNIDTSGSVRWTKLIKNDQFTSLKQVLKANNNTALILGEITSPSNTSIQNIYIENTSLNSNLLGCSDSLVTALEMLASFTTDTITLDSVSGIFQSTNINWVLQPSFYDDSLLCSTCDNIIANGFLYSDSLLTISFNDTLSNSSSWFWDFGDGSTDTTQSPTHTYLSPGTYYVCMSASNICSSDTICDSITVVITGLDETTEKNQVNIFPNPFNSFSTLSSNFRMENAKLEILNNLGKAVIVTENISGNKVTINRSNLSSGIYYYRLLQSNYKPIIGKIVIK